jgi:hypothetical protein
VQARTGKRGYFGNAGFTADTWHMMKTEPRSDSMRFAFAHEEHSPSANCFSGASAMGDRIAHTSGALIFDGRGMATRIGKLTSVMRRALGI